MSDEPEPRIRVMRQTFGRDGMVRLNLVIDRDPAYENRYVDIDLSIDEAQRLLAELSQALGAESNEKRER
jgi:hypothetical protein